jgi:pimeloyl-ACP methyl ester carboxylesterase
MPAVALPGLRADPFFRILTTPGLGRLAAHAPTPKSVAATRKGMATVLGERALDRTPDALFELVRAGMAKPGWGIWGDRDINGGPEIGRRATELLTDARLKVIERGDAPFLDDPEHCAQLIRQLT